MVIGVKINLPKATLTNGNLANTKESSFGPYIALKTPSCKYTIQNWNIRYNH